MSFALLRIGWISAVVSESVTDASTQNTNGEELLISIAISFEAYILYHKFTG